MFILKNVTKTYKKRIALQPTDLCIDQGEIFGIIGESGAGKSTLLRCLASLSTPCSGEILFNGQNLSEMNQDQLKEFRQNIGMIFQQFNLFSSRTVFQNIAYPLEIIGITQEQISERVTELLEFVGLAEYADAYPATLSGGQKQRVAIARAIARNPKVLFCDEATSALDPQTTEEVLKLLQKINQTLGITIILITHDMNVIDRICHRVQEVKRFAHV